MSPRLITASGDIIRLVCVGDVLVTALIFLDTTVLYIDSTRMLLE